MSVTVEWDDNQHVIIISVHDEWAWADYRAKAITIVGLLDDSTHPITIIHNMRGSTYMPSPGFVDNMRHAAQTYHTHPNTSTVITITSSHAIQYLFEQTWRQYSVAQRSYLFAKSLNEAYTLIGTN